jgi:hypothetical protein
MEQTAWWYELGQTLVRFLPFVVLIVWCLWAVDWRKAWPVLAAGGWVPLVLIAVVAAVVWSLVFPTSALVFGLVDVPNGLWQLGAVALLIGIVLVGGWLQTRLGWYPPNISFDPPLSTGLHDHDHGHDVQAPPATISHPTH